MTGTVGRPPTWARVARAWPTAAAPADLSVAAHLQAQARSTPRFQRSARPVAGSYIVQLAEGTTPTDVEATADALLAQYGGTRTAVFTHAIQGFAARMPDAVAQRLSDDARVHHVEEDAVHQASQNYGSGDSFLGADATGVSTSPNPLDAISNWALDRIDQRNPPPLVGGIPQFNGQHNLRGTGAGVHVYVVDSTYNLFGDTGTLWHLRLPGATFYDPGGAVECSGHGTIMASVIAGRVAGVARGAFLHPVRVLDCNNETDTTRLLQGLNWIAANVVKPAVVNLSISGPQSSTFNAAVANLVNVTGVLVVGAAGNGNVDACTSSPASEPATLTVGAASGFDGRSTFSNYGSCVDLNAPGTVTDAASYQPGALTFATIRQRATGTSVSTALVTGAAALYLERYPAAPPAQVRAALIDNATTGVLNAATLNGSPNKLLYTAFIPYAAQNASGQELGVNYVTNGNFESGTTGWNPLLIGTNSIGTGTAALPAYSGTRRLMINDVGGFNTRLTGINSAPYSPANFVLRFRLRVSTTLDLQHCETDRLLVTVPTSSTGFDFIRAGEYTACAGYYNGATTDEYRDTWVDLGTNAFPGTFAPFVEFWMDTVSRGSTFLIDDVRVIRATPSAVTAWTPLLNPNFELGNNGNWTWTRASGSAFVAGGGGANGTWSAQLGNWANGVAHTDTLYQNLTISVDSVEPRITIPVTMTTSETGTTAVDTLAIEVRDPSTNAVLATLGTYSNLTPGSTVTYSLDRWIGRTIRLQFTAVTNNNTKATTFKVDNITATRRTWTSPVLP